MKTISIELDNDTAEKIATLIDDTRPTLNACAVHVLKEAARARDHEIGVRMCECSILHRAADDPDHPVKFDPRLNEYNIRHGNALARIRYCYFCGGLAPPSKRQSMFVHVPQAEVARLGGFCANIHTLEDAIAALGPPDVDQAIGHMSTGPADTGLTNVHRVIIYKKLSDFADVRFTEMDGKRATKSFQAKSISDSSAERVASKNES